MHIDNNLKCKIGRYNEVRRKLFVRTGRIDTDGTAVRAWWPTTQSEPCQLYAQLHVLPDPNEVVPDPNEVVPDPNEHLPDPNEVVPDPNEVVPDPNEVEDKEDQRFATKGDSGSLVFLESDDGEHMWGFGMVVGGIEDEGSAIVTPIWAVLDTFITTEDT